MAENVQSSSLRKKVNRSYSVDQACIFEMDGIDFEILDNSENQPTDNNDYYNSDNDDEDDAPCEDTDERDDLPSKPVSSKSVRQFATSLPIQVPLWNPSHILEPDDDDDTVNITCDEDPNKIAESFRALAWSVKDGSEMFGALPRRRLNTGDLVKSRPI